MNERSKGIAPSAKEIVSHTDEIASCAQEIVPYATGHIRELELPNEEARRLWGIPASRISLAEHLTLVGGIGVHGKEVLLKLLAHPLGALRRYSVLNKPCVYEFPELFEETQCCTNTLEEPLYRLYFSAPDRAPLEVYADGATCRGASRVSMDYPVLYVGLERLYPLNIDKDTRVFRPNLTPEEELLYWDLYQRIYGTPGAGELLRLRQGEIKDTLVFCPETQRACDAPAELDCLGQLFGALISLRRLSQDRKSWNGGICLIDEVDAGLSLPAKVSLIDFALTLAREYQFQVVMTTSSLSVWAYVSELKSRDHSSDIALYTFATHNHSSAGEMHAAEIEECSTPAIELYQGNSVLEREDDVFTQLLSARSPQPVQQPPCTIGFWCDSEETSRALSWIMATSEEKFDACCAQYAIISGCLGRAGLNDLYTARDLSPLRHSLVVYTDPQFHTQDSDDAARKFLALPEDVFAAEKMILSGLQTLPEGDAFWDLYFGQEATALRKYHLVHRRFHDDLLDWAKNQQGEPFEFAGTDGHKPLDCYVTQDYLELQWRLLNDLSAGRPAVWRAIMELWQAPYRAEIETFTDKLQAEMTRLATEYAM